MKIWAKVTATGTAKGALIQAFGEEFSSQNSIVIKDDAAIVELVFDDKPPKQILEAIANSDVVVFKSGNLSEECWNAIESVDCILAKENPNERGESATAKKEHDGEPFEESFQSEEGVNLQKVKQIDAQEEVEPIPVADIADTSEEQQDGENCEESVATQSLPEEEVATDEMMQPREDGESQDDASNLHKANSEENADAEQVHIQETKSVRKSRFPTTSLELEEEIKKIVENSTSFDNLIQNVAKWLNMDNTKQEYVTNLLEVMKNVDKLSWSNLEAALTSAGIVFGKFDKRVCEKKLSDVLSGEVNFLGVLKIIDGYRTFNFACDEQEKSSTETVDDIQSESVQKAEENSSQPYDDSATEEAEPSPEPESETVAGKPEERQEIDVSQKRIQMECMPEIPSLVEALDKACQMQSVAEKIEFVLETIGLKSRKPKEQKYILAIANAAVEMDQMDIEDLVSKAGVPNNSASSARMAFSQMINNFVQKNNHTNKVKLVDFLKDLQQVVMS